MLYKQRHKIENMFGKTKDWCRIAPRYDRRAHTFFQHDAAQPLSSFLSINES